jgi:hypothetical protein
MPIPIAAKPIKSLLDDFQRAPQSSSQQELERADEFGQFLSEFGSATAKWRVAQQSKADGFNLLAVLGLEYEEVRHSMVICWLLDHDPRRFGSHCQGNLGFRLFLESLEHRGFDPNYADVQYIVRREVAGRESRIDVRVESPGFFIIDIENKISAEEGDDQTQREWHDLQQRAKEIQVSSGSRHAVYLSPEGEPPFNPKFVAMSYWRLAGTLDRFAAEAQAKDVRLFAAHYAKALRQSVITHSTEEDEDE